MKRKTETIKAVLPFALLKRGKSLHGYISLFLLSVMMLFASCVDEVEVDSPNKGNNVTDKEITFRVAVPATSGNTGNAPQTRSIGATQENTINTIYVLAFKVTTDNGGNILSETYDYSAVGTKSSTNTEGAASQNFNVTVKVKDYKQRFVVITNADNAVTALTGDPTTWVGANKSTMLAELKVSLGNFEDRWNAVSASNYTAFPMWGESAAETITGTTTALSMPVPMLRMIAKIDVQLDETVAGLTNKFKIKSVYLYNTNTTGHVAPSSITEEVRNGNRYLLVTNPTIPTGATLSEGPIEYKDFTSPGTADVAMKGAIYTFETLAPADKDMMKATCLVIGGLYGTNTDETYYRVDFLENDKQTFRHILRNHQYIVNIVDVKGKGHNTADDAYRSKSVNMIADILAWNDGGMGDVIFGDHYYLGVKYPEIVLNRKAQTSTQYITTSFPQGWTYKLMDSKEETGNELGASDWIRFVSRTNKGAEQTDEFVFEVDAYPGDSERVAYLHVTANNFTLVTKIVQNNTMPFLLQLTPNDILEFESGVSLASGVEIDPQTVNIFWEPSERPANYKVRVIGSDGGLTFLQPVVADITQDNQITGGDVNLTFQPEKFTELDVDPAQGGNPFLEKISRLEVTATNDKGEAITRTLTIKQKNYAIQTEVEDVYILEGGEGIVTVKANTPWRAELIAGGDAIDAITLGQGQGDTSTGELLKFNLLQGDATHYEGDSQIRIYSPSGKFADVIVDIKAYLLIWVGNLGYLPDTQVQGPVIFGSASALCTAKGYTLPTRSIANAWITSSIPTTELGNIWMAEYGYRQLVNLGASRSYSVNVYATSLTATKVLQYTHIYTESGTTGNAQAGGSFVTKDRGDGSGYYNKYTYGGTIPSTSHTTNVAYVRCVKHVATK